MFLAARPRSGKADISLEDFQEDVHRALDKNFGEFVEADQLSNDAKYRIYRVVVHGTVSDIAMRWIYYLVADPKGRQAALTFAIEQEHVDRFADADKPLVQSLRLSKRRKRGKPISRRRKRPTAKRKTEKRRPPRRNRD